MEKNCLTCILMGPFKLAYMDIHVCPRTSWTRPHRSHPERSAWNIRVDAHAKSTHKVTTALSHDPAPAARRSPGKLNVFTRVANPRLEVGPCGARRTV
ncbi:hypothetical protein J6590_061736 [Homalodisca vitripennis]|nr:hypothetical protein J6590_061736 [Homalodisca vitripennis]